MIGHNIATLTDVRGQNDIEVEVNKDGKEEDFVEFKIRDCDGDYIKSYISIKDLYGLVFLLVGPEEQADMIPIKKTEMRSEVRKIRVKAQKDIKRGEEIVVNYKLDYPLIIEENVNKLLGKSRRNSGIII